MIVADKNLVLKHAKDKKLAEITKSYNDSVSALVGNTDQYEMISWAKQEAEARAYMADNTVSTPILSEMVKSRKLGESVADLAKKIITNADEFQKSYASILGDYQVKQKAIEAAKTVEEVQAIVQEGSYKLIRLPKEEFNSGELFLKSTSKIKEFLYKLLG